MNTMNSVNILHTEEIKKKYSAVEREIKRQLTEIILLNNIWFKDNVCRWLSITKDFKIRRLSPDENSKFLSNPSTIKSPVISLTTQKVKANLFKLIDQNIDNSVIAKKYKSWIDDFFLDLQKENLKMRHRMIDANSTTWTHNFTKYLRQCKESTDIKKSNVKMQMAKILYAKFGEDAFCIKATRNKKDIITFSEKSLNYIYTLFYNANKVWESWWKSIDKVFHDGDYPFITENIRVWEADYVDVLTYLVDKSKSIFYGKRWSEWQAQWSRKKSQYADILRALTDDQLDMDKLVWDTHNENPDFKRDDTTQNLATIWWWLLENVVVTHNTTIPVENKKLKLSKRLKSLSSSTEKIIEWKKINDTIWFRLSMRGISDQNFDDIKKISKTRFEMFNASLKAFPTKYVPEWYTIEIKDVCIDNKWIFEPEQVDEIVQELNKIVPTMNRPVTKSPYISKDEREKRIDKHYPDIKNDTQKWDAIQTFYQRISKWKSRGKNWWYKDFKFNITFDVKDPKWVSVDEKVMEIQFDDINNGKWLANYNIRNFERWLNTQSRLSFSVPLSEARKSCEKNLKKMYQWAKIWTEKWLTKEEKQSFFEIPFDDGTVINISQFRKRNDWNSRNMDNAIIKIINYFLQKWTFILCRSNKSGQYEPLQLNNWLLSIEDLHDSQKMEDIHICSSLELASQQHSYLQQNWDRSIGIYLPNQHDTGRITVWELIDPMNLWKIKDKKYSANI